ncbi:MAG: GNAT family N-acetyltransferase [Patescibacteria group bacterium]
MKIIKATKKDIPEIIRLNRRYFHEKRDYPKIIGDKDTVFFVVKEKGEIIGFSGIKHFRWNNTAKVINIFLRPVFRHKGYGKALIKILIKAAKKRRARTLIAEGPSLNPVVKFYRRNGFRVCGRNDRYYDNKGREIAVFLSYDLKK